MSDSKPSTVGTSVTDQIVIGYHHRLAAQGPAKARELIARTMAALRPHGVVELDSYVANGSDDSVSFAASLVRLDDPGFTLSDLLSLVGAGKHDAIAFCERNAPVETLAHQPLRTPNAFNDPLAYEQWPLAVLEATDPWTVKPPAGTTIVSIVDSGLRRFDGSVHADLGSVQPVPTCQPPRYADQIDREGHGTRLAGTIAAVFDNSIGVASAVPQNWGISLLPIKFFETGEPATAYFAAISITCAADQGAKVINASWHVPPGDPDLANLKNAIIYAMGKGALTVAAAGNAGSNNEIYPIWPADFGATAPLAGNGMMTVMATDRYDVKAPFSNYGPNIIDIAAPGLSVMTTGPYLTDTPRYMFYSGTSAAAAYVSSGAALTYALNPTWGPGEVITHLSASADVVPGLKLACKGGLRLNLKRAVYGPIIIDAPDDGDVVHAGQQTKIRWSNDYIQPNFTQVAIEFSKDDGMTWMPVVASTANDGKFNWTPVAAQRTNTAKLRIAPTNGNYPAQSGRFKVV